MDGDYAQSETEEETCKFQLSLIRFVQEPT